MNALQAIQAARLVGRTILVATPHALVRATVASTLRRAGARVLEAGDGLTALRSAYRTKHVDVFVTESSLPVIPVDATVTRLRSLLPGLHVVVVGERLPGLSDSVYTLPTRASPALVDVVVRLLATRQATA